MMPITMDVAALTKREHAYRARLAGLMTLVLVLGFTILLTFKSQTSNMNSDYRLLGLRDLCNRNRQADDCPDDPTKTNPGLCGCGIPDTDTDGDKTPDCQDDCPRDAKTTSSGACGCGIPETDTDGDGTPECHDDCPRDAKTTSSGACGCGIPDTDTDTDGDGTPECHDDCPRDSSKTSSGACGCGSPDTGIDTNGDGKAGCKGDCTEDDIVSQICLTMQTYNHWDCEACAEDYIRASKNCGRMCLSDIDYCIEYKFEIRFEYVGYANYTNSRVTFKTVQSGIDSSNSVWDLTVDWDSDGNFVVYSYLNGVPCTVLDPNEETECLKCEDGKEYCYEEGVPLPPSNPFFSFSNAEAHNFIDNCLNVYKGEASTLEIGTSNMKFPQRVRDFLTTALSEQFLNSVGV